MKIKLDENIPFEIVPFLTQLGHDVDTVPQEGLAGSADPDIWQAAQAEGRFLITQDLDFSDVRRFAPGSHYGLLLIRMSQPGRKALIARVFSLFQQEDVASWQRCFIVTTDQKLRIKRPNQ